MSLEPSSYVHGLIGNDVGGVKFGAPRLTANVQNLPHVPIQFTQVSDVFPVLVLRRFSIQTVGDVPRRIQTLYDRVPVRHQLVRENHHLVKLRHVLQESINPRALEHSPSALALPIRIDERVV